MRERTYAMVTKIKKWNNSQGLRIPKALLDEAQIDIGDEVNISVRGGQIIVEPVSKVRSKYDLKKLVGKIPKTYRAEEADWERAIGKEVW